MDIPKQAERRLLILDDDPMTGQTIKSIAEFAGLAVMFTPNPVDFFQLVDTWHPTHIAIDLVMPEMDGVQVMTHLADRHCASQIIITSGVGTRVLDAARRSAVEHGLNIVGVLAKPFTPARLRRLLVDAEPLGVTRPPPTASAREPKITEQMLRNALQNHAISAYYQPKIVCATGAITGFEVLARWHDPELGMIPPSSFIPLAENSGLIDELTVYMLRLSLPWFVLLARDTMHLAINISARTLSNRALFDDLLLQCQAYKIDPQRLTFELTETSAMDDPTASLDLLTRLRMHGFHLSIDDFGTGFSSMLQLVRLPFSEIKVDKSFVMTAMESEESRTVTRFIVELGHSLGLRCTAEGVENAATLAYLQEIHCDMAQGYGIARPMPGPEALHWLQHYLTP